MFIRTYDVGRFIRTYDKASHPNFCPKVSQIVMLVMCVSVTANVKSYLKTVHDSLNK